MRVISGSKRGIKLLSAEGIGTRPTADRVKESMFNVIQWNIDGSRILDLFAGSGSLGIEALSRGAVSAVFVDASKESFEVINANVKKTGFCDISKIFCLDYEIILKKSEKYDIIFLDPPYKSDFMEKALDLIHKNCLLSPDGIVVCEFDKDSMPGLAGFEIHKEKLYGNTKLLFLKIGDNVE